MQLGRLSIFWLSQIFSVIVCANEDEPRDECRKEFIEEYKNEGAQKKVGDWIEDIEWLELEYFCEQLNFPIHIYIFEKQPPRKVIGSNISISTMLCNDYILVPSKTGYYYSFSKVGDDELDILCKYHPLDQFKKEFYNLNRHKQTKKWVRWVISERHEEICTAYNFKFNRPVSKLKELEVKETNFKVYTIRCAGGIHLVPSRNHRYYWFIRKNKTLHFKGVATRIKEIPASYA